MECFTGPGQGFYEEEAQKDYVQYGFMSWQGYVNHMGYQYWDPSFPYQEVIISDNQEEVSSK